MTRSLASLHPAFSRVTPTFAAACLIVAACQGKPARPPRPPVPVTVAVARQTSALAASEPDASSYTAAPRNPYHTLVWSDEFTGPAGSAPNPANWTPDSGGGCGDNTLSTNTARLANASLDGNGGLAIRALLNPGGEGGSQFTSASITTAGHYSFTYGTIEARIEMPAGSVRYRYGRATNRGASAFPFAFFSDSPTREHE